MGHAACHAPSHSQVSCRYWPVLSPPNITTTWCTGSSARAAPSRVEGSAVESFRSQVRPSESQVSLLTVAPRPPNRRIWPRVESNARLVARGHNGALISEDTAGHTDAVGKGMADGEGAVEIVADGLSEGVGDPVATGVELLHAVARGVHNAHRTRQSRLRGFRCSFACARWRPHGSGSRGWGSSGCKQDQSPRPPSSCRIRRTIR